MGEAPRRPAPLLFVPVYGQLELAARAVRAIDRTSTADAPLLVIDDAGPERVDEAWLRAVVTSGRTCRLLRHEHNRGFVASANEAIAARTGGGVVVVNSDVVVFEGWLEALRTAAEQTAVASVTAVTNHGSVATSVAAARCASSEELASMAAAARDSHRTPVPIPVAVGHCTLLTDAALADVGSFDEAFSPGFGEEVDWSIRATRRGWRHLAHPGVVVWHEGGSSFGRAGWARRRHELILLRRYPTEVLGFRRHPVRLP